MIQLHKSYQRRERRSLTLTGVIHPPMHPHWKESRSCLLRCPTSITGQRTFLRFFMVWSSFSALIISNQIYGVWRICSFSHSLSPQLVQLKQLVKNQECSTSSRCPSFILDERMSCIRTYHWLSFMVNAISYLRVQRYPTQFSRRRISCPMH